MLKSSTPNRTSPLSPFPHKSIPKHLTNAPSRIKNEKRDLLSYAAGLGAKVGINSYAPTSNAWIGSDGPYTNTFTNDAGVPLVLYCWGPAGSWVNDVPPLISHPLSAGESVDVSYAEGASGACSHVTSDITMVNGQIFNTWIEYTFAGVWTTYDVSREVNMNGRAISTVGPSCTTDMNTCVFVCEDESLPSCWYGYTLKNCGTSNGGGSGNDPNLGGAPSGGCNGISGGSGHLRTSLQ
jgi:hypothetical protein